MSLRPDGSYRCDRCGADVGNAGVTIALIVSDVDPDTGLVRVLHFCREPNPGAPDGCAAHLLIPSNLTDYLASEEG